MSEKWWDISDDELDDLFREASDKAEIPFDSSALDKLRQKIDFKPMSQPALPQGFNKRWMAVAGLLIFFGAALLYTFNKDKSTNKKGVKYDFPLEKNSSTRKKSNSIPNNNLLKNKLLDISTTKFIHKKTPTSTLKLNGSDSRVVKEKKDVDVVNSSTISYFPKLNRPQSKLVNSKFNNNQGYNPSVHQEALLPISTFFIIPENKPVEEELIPRTNFYTVDFLTSKATKPLQINIDFDPPTYVEVPPMVMKQPELSRFGVRFAIAPEINSIERMETQAVVSSMFALLLEYRLTKKLTIQTGINFSKKKYSGDFEYYRAWTGGTGIKPLTIDGICSVVDIPVNVRLNAFQRNRNTFFISGGVSSYLMSDEIYTYNYAWGPSKVRDWNGTSSSFYWSTLNLSAGIERKINKHFTLQIEPFLKTPLVGVGRGTVNLYSSGLLFSTKYEF